jgi:hypothetical protein
MLDIQIAKIAVTENSGERCNLPWDNRTINGLDKDSKYFLDDWLDDRPSRHPELGSGSQASTPNGRHKSVAQHYS